VELASAASEGKSEAEEKKEQVEQLKD